MTVAPMEVFGSNRALWFSPDGKKLAYGRFNDTLTPLMVIPVYGVPGTLEYQYPRANLIKYPKAGTTNPTATLHVVDLSEPATELNLEVPSALSSDPILSVVEWATNDSAVAIWMNRIQNQASIVSYDVSSDVTSFTVSLFQQQIYQQGILTRLLQVRSLESADGWLELFTPPIFSSDGSKLVLILSQDQGDSSGGYKHIVLLNREEGASEQALTKGTFVVTEILAWNHAEDLIYYLANTESDSAVQHLYTVSPSTSQTKCLTCERKSKHNTSYDCSYNTAEFSKDATHYALTCAGPDVPQISIHSADGEEKLGWHDNDDLVTLTSGNHLPTLTKMSFDIAGGFKANVLLRLPPNIDTSGDTKYPMVVNVYGGPDTFQVVDKFVLDWGSYLAANKSIIYAAIDGRGSGLRETTSCLLDTGTWEP
ncbi:hypothetical protein NQ318_020209 [Aromia moschata]|uniref:Dipeptidylpeptidase IV N-terminal domain-containing protein n=1 Tax=Aromia moschata TaxID=1265417 RepID=A0AAV8ZBG5_9CUCU|nr:hypothetical protein NQ318_020209 [Aromia moschata]